MVGAPIGRNRAIEFVRAGEFPVWLGGPVPTAVILEQDGAFRIRGLVGAPTPPPAESGGRQRTPSWMPSHRFDPGEPIGEIFAEAPTPAGLVEVMQRMEWPHEW